MKNRKSKKLPKKRKNQQHNSKILPIINIIAILIILAIVTIGYFYNDNEVDSTNDNKTILEKNTDTQSKIATIPNKKATYKEQINSLEIQFAKQNNIKIEPIQKINKPYTKFTYEEPTQKDMNNIEHIVNKIDIPEINKIEYIKKERVEQEIFEKQKNIDKFLTNKPKLIIIIDDVTARWQINEIKNIGYKINMAFLPPTKNHKNSAKIIKDLKQYMIHLPLQASDFKYEEENTLHITDSLIRIDARVEALKKLYPKAKYINNHTGSKFTSNPQAMDKLLKVIKKYNFNFIDSRTTAKSVAKLSARKYGVKMYSRNIFLDNKKDKEYIKKQLRRATRIAKKSGYAIAIGHPYRITFETLKESKDILEDFELIYVEQLK